MRSDDQLRIPDGSIDLPDTGKFHSDIRARERRFVGLAQIWRLIGIDARSNSRYGQVTRA